jgi:signal transduction histidine kinase
VATDFPASRSTEPSRATSAGWFVAVAAVLAGWTMAILLTSGLTFQIHSARARLPFEAVSVTVMIFVCALAYIQYSLTNSTTAFFTALAFLALAANQLVFGLFLGTGTLNITAKQELYFWTVGRLLAGALLILAAMGLGQGALAKRPSRHFALGAGVVLAAQAAIQGVLWGFRTRLPALSSVTLEAVASRARGPLPGLTAVDFALGISGAGLFLTAAVLYQRRLRMDPSALPWLPTALLLAAFSHLHYMFFPTVFTARISTADALRLALTLLLLIGLMWEVRRTFRQRAEQLALAYQAERRRVAELERLDRARSELFSILTHELLHPVSAIRALALTLTKRWDSIPEEKRVRVVERIEAESGRLREVAEAATIATTFEGEGLALAQRPEAAIEVAREAAEMVDELGGRLKLIVGHGGESAIVNVDRVRILQALRNLLSNADKYSEEGTPIELALSNGVGQVTFSVSNRGPGIPPEEVPSLFQRFSRTRPAGKEDVPGSGLGLYISKLIVDSHGGRIWVESWPGRQTTFSFSVPTFDAFPASTTEGSTS